MLLDGIELNEPLRDRPMEVPLIVTRAAELVSGGLDAEYGGALAGVLNVRTFDPERRFQGELAWSTDGRLETEYDRVAGRASGPLGLAGLGLVAGAEATLDGTSLPSLRSRFVFVTGDTASETTRSFLQKAGRPYLMKPFAVEDYVQALRDSQESMRLI